MQVRCILKKKKKKNHIFIVKWQNIDIKGKKLLCDILKFSFYF